MISEMELAKGDVLIIKKPVYPLANNDGVADVEYIVVYDRPYRPYAATYALRADKNKLEYDSEWNMTEFHDDQIVMKLAKATEIHQEFMAKRDETNDAIRAKLAKIYSPDAVDVAMKMTFEQCMRQHMGTFLKDMYKEYVQTYIEHEE